jgi:hypothetical protein
MLYCSVQVGCFFFFFLKKKKKTLFFGKEQIYIILWILCVLFAGLYLIEIDCVKDGLGNSFMSERMIE